MKLFASLLFIVVVLIGLDVKAEVAVFDTTHCYGQCPEGFVTIGNTLIRRELYLMSYNPIRRMADWVAYRVEPKNFVNAPKRSRNWKRDPLLLWYFSTGPTDYNRAHEILSTDRGHLVPLGSFSKHSKWKTLNYLSNITPQNSIVNQGLWKQLEEDIRTLSIETRKMSGFVYVVTGTLFKNKQQQLPGMNRPHMIPSHHWKVVFSKSNIDVFLVPQDATQKDTYCSFMISLGVLEQETELQFKAIEYYEKMTIKRRALCK